MSVDLIARGMSGYAMNLALNGATKKFIGSTALTAGNEQAELTAYDKNVTGGNPVKGDQIADTRTGTIWEYNGAQWFVSSYNPDRAQITINKNDIADIRNELGDYDDRITKNENDITDLNTKLTQEIKDRKDEDKKLSDKDDDLQDQIDAISALAKGVKEVVGTYADIANIDKDKLVTGDIINVLADETRDGVNAYYRYDADTQQYTFIGTIAPYYTKIETDNKLTDLKDTIDQEHQDKLDELDEKIQKKQNKLVAGKGVILTDDTVTETTTIAITTEDTTDTPVENSEQAFNAGGAYKLAPTLNGQKVLENPTFYAPETIGTENQIITVDANGQLVWADNEGGGGDVRKVTINNIEQPLDPIDKILSIDTDDTLTERAGTNILSVSKANIPITKAEYEALPQADREDESKVYLITDDVTDAPELVTEIDDTMDAAQSEVNTRSNKYITDNIQTSLSSLETWRINSGMTINGEVKAFMDNTFDATFYAPLEAGTAGKAIVWDDTNNKAVWGDASKVTLNGTETTDAVFYAPTTSGTEGQILKSKGENNAPEYSDDYVPKITLNGTAYSGVNANPTFYAPTVTPSSAAKKYMINNGTTGTYSGIEIPSIDVYDGSCTVPQSGSWTNVSSLKFYSGTPSYTSFFSVDSVSFLPKYSGTYELSMNCLHTRSSTSGWLSFAWGASSGSSLYSHYLNTDNSGTRIPFVCRCVLHCNANTWYYPLFKNSGTSGNDAVSYISFTVNLLQLD